MGPAMTPPAPKYRSIQSTLTTRIQRGEYPSGLPGERALAQEFGVARVTIRSALAALDDAGLVQRQARRGTLATAGPDATAHRRLLREHVDKFLDRGRHDRRKVLQMARMAAPAAVARALGLAPGASVLRIVRVRADDKAPLTYTESFVPLAFSHTLTRAALERKALVQMLEEAGVRISSAEQDFTCIAATAQVASALQIAPDAPVWKFHRVLFDPEGRPIQLLLGWYRADRFEIRMRLSREEDATKVWLDYR